VKGIPQGIPTTPFVEEVSETLPSVQGINLTLRKQQLVKEFPKSKFPLPSETTQFHVSTEEPKHPIPIHDCYDFYLCLYFTFTFSLSFPFIT
jgi:hypothetical protein